MQPFALAYAKSEAQWNHIQVSDEVAPISGSHRRSMKHGTTDYFLSEANRRPNDDQPSGPGSDSRHDDLKLQPIATSQELKQVLSFKVCRRSN